MIITCTYFYIFVKKATITTLILMASLVIWLVATSTLSNAWTSTKTKCSWEPVQFMVRVPCTKNKWPWCKLRHMPSLIKCSTTLSRWLRRQLHRRRKHTTSSIKALLVAWCMDLMGFSRCLCLTSSTFHIHHNSSEGRWVKCNIHHIWCIIQCTHMAWGTRCQEIWISPILVSAKAAPRKLNLAQKRHKTSKR